MKCNKRPAIVLMVFLFSLCFLTSASAATNNYPSVTQWPLAYHYQDDERSRTDVIYPVFHYKSKGSYSRFAIRPFLYNLEKDPARDFRQVNVIWPLSHFETEGDRFKRYVFPFYFHRQGDTEFSYHAWPFYGHSLKADDTESWSTIYPFFQYQRNELEGRSQVDYLWPLGRSVTEPDRSSSYFIPLWWNKQEPTERGRFIFPYFMYETEASRQDAILPLWYRMRAEEEKRDFLGLWYDHQKEDYRFRTLFPLYWDYENGPDRKLSLFVPLYGNYRAKANDYQAFFPFYFRHSNRDLESEFRYYFPLYGYYQKGDDVRHAYYLFPLYAHIEDETVGREAWYFLWPLVYRDVFPDKRETWVVPFYWSKATPQRQHSLALIPPYYSYAADEGRKEKHLWPFFGLSQDPYYTERSVVWPLFRWGTSPDGDRGSWQLLLLYRKYEPQRNMVGFFPLWHYDRDADRTRNVSLLHWQEVSDDARQFSLIHALNPDWSLFTTKREDDTRHHHLFPLYSYTEKEAQDEKDLYVIGPVYRYRTVGEEKWSHNFLWKVLYHEQAPDEHEAGFLWRLIRSKKDAEGSLFEFNPFYYSETRPDSDSYTSWLGGMYAVRKEGDDARHTLFWMINW